jgi:hypothetical protein
MPPTLDAAAPVSYAKASAPKGRLRTLCPCSVFSVSSVVTINPLEGPFILPNGCQELENRALVTFCVSNWTSRAESRAGPECLFAGTGGSTRSVHQTDPSDDLPLPRGVRITL